MERVEITTESINLQALLKFCGAASSGGEAKMLIADGLVSVGGTVCTQRGKKLSNGDIVALSGKEYEVVAKCTSSPTH